MYDTVITLLVFLIAFGGMVFLHEFGHFLAARLCGIEVEEFGFGLPTPGAITLFHWLGTRFTLNWLPLGGFVRPKGENDPNVEGGLAAASPWKRLVVLFAGPLMNLLTAVVVLSLITSIRGGIITVSPDGTNTQILVTSIMPGSPAEQAGLKAGDVLISGNGQPIKNSTDIGDIVNSNVDKAVNFVVARDGKQLDFTITPKFNQQEGRPLIGIEYLNGYSFQPVTSLSQNVTTSFKQTGTMVYELVTLPVKLIRGSVPADQGRLVGFKGIYDIMKQTVASDVQAANQPPPSSTTTASVPNPYDKPVSTLSLIVILSISLGVFNLFPFPALDGGRILFVLPELITRRRVPAQFENIVHGVGFMILVAFMLYINVMEFIRPTIIPK